MLFEIYCFQFECRISCCRYIIELFNFNFNFIKLLPNFSHKKYFMKSNARVIKLTPFLPLTVKVERVLAIPLRYYLIIKIHRFNIVRSTLVNTPFPFIKREGSAANPLEINSHLSTALTIHFPIVSTWVSHRNYLFRHSEWHPAFDRKVKITSPSGCGVEGWGSWWIFHLQYPFCHG